MKVKLYYLILMIVICAVFIAGCGKAGQEPNETTAPTEKITKAPTPEPTPSPTPKPTVIPISEEKKGIPQENAVVLFEDDFEEDNLDDKYFSAQGEFLSVEDGKLTLLENWTAYLPEVPYDLGVEHSQYEISFKYQADAKSEDVAWSSLFIGVRGPVDGTVPIATQDGIFWVALNGSNKAYVYPGGGGTYTPGSAWNQKYFTVNLPENFMDKAHTITVVDCGDVICYYMDTANNNLYLILKVVFEEDELVCYDKAGEEIWREESMLAESGSFLFFNHYGKTFVDDLVIKGLA